jgi:hypothetical protein
MWPKSLYENPCYRRRFSAEAMRLASRPWLTILGRTS